MARLMLVVWVTLTLAAVVHAQPASDIQTVRNQIQSLQDQLKAALQRLDELEKKQAAPAPAPKPSWPDTLKVGGYFQARYEARRGTVDDFLFRRMYITLLATPNSRTTGLVTLRRTGLATDPAIDFEAAQVDYKIDNQWTARFGQVMTNWGWDGAESSSKRIPLDRFVGVEGIAARTGRPGINGMYFRGPSDRGMYIVRNPQRREEPMVTLGLVNGNFTASDNDNNKTYSVDLKWQKRWGSYGASWMDGKYLYQPPGTPAPPMVDTDRQGLNLWAHSDPAPWGFQTEYVKGKLAGNSPTKTNATNMNGWYGQVAYNRGTGTPFLRYEILDPDTAATGDTYSGWHIGCAYQPDRNNKLTLEYADAGRGP